MNITRLVNHGLSYFPAFRNLAHISSFIKIYNLKLSAYASFTLLLCIKKNDNRRRALFASWFSVSPNFAG